MTRSLTTAPTQRFSVWLILAQNVVFCSIVALLLWRLVPSIGQYGLLNNFVYAQAIGNTICVLAMALSRLLIRAGIRTARLQLLSMLVVTPLGVYVGMALAGRLLGIPRESGGTVYSVEQFLISGVVAVLASLAFNWHLSSREKLLRLELEASEERRRAESARFAMLRAQIEPHMLFNTLANLRALIQTDRARATEMLDRLDSFLRATLGSSRQIQHTLQQEFKVLEDYLALMQVRLDKRLRYTLSLPDGCQPLQVPALILQPLVENSIKHGIEPKIAGGRVSVSAQLDGNTLVLIVEDSGVGMGAAPATPASSDAGGFGLANLQQRLKQTYAGEASIQYAPGDSQPSATGTRVTVTIPLARTGQQL